MKGQKLVFQIEKMCGIQDEDEKVLKNGYIFLIFLLYPMMRVSKTHFCSYTSERKFAKRFTKLLSRALPIEEVKKYGAK